MQLPATPGWGLLLVFGGWPLAIPRLGPWVQFPAISSWGAPLLEVVGPSVILAERPGCSSPPFLAMVCWCGVGGRALCVFVVCGVCVRVVWCMVWYLWSTPWCPQCLCLCGCGVCVPAA